MSLVMKGLKEYIAKHGRHFTEELAYDTAGNWWSAETVEVTAQRKVYYNVTGSTIGDMVYLVNEIYADGLLRRNTIDNCVGSMLCIIGSYDNGRDAAFSDWIDSITDFDFTPYI
jgi:hypothetical protein